MVDTIIHFGKNGCNYQLYAMNTDTTTAFDPLAVQRVRNAVQVRSVQVQQVHRTSPHLVRIRFSGEALRGFASASFDDHIKFMLPPDLREPLVALCEAQQVRGTLLLVREGINGTAAAMPRSRTSAAGRWDS